MQLFLLPCSCSCFHEAGYHTLTCSYLSPPCECGYIPCHLNCSLSCYHAAISTTCHHVAILAAMPLFLPPCGCFCYHAAIPREFLPPHGYSCSHAGIFTAVWLYCPVIDFPTTTMVSEQPAASASSSQSHVDYIPTWEAYNSFLIGVVD